MPAPSARVSLSLEQLLEAVGRLSPARCGSLSVAWPCAASIRGKIAQTRAPLVRAREARLAPAADRRLKTLIARSERGKLTREELAEYQALRSRSSSLMQSVSRHWGS